MSVLTASQLPPVFIEFFLEIFSNLYYIILFIICQGFFATKALQGAPVDLYTIAEGIPAVLNPNRLHAFGYLVSHVIEK
jgi:hypothetical protein